MKNQRKFHTRNQDKAVSLSSWQNKPNSPLFQQKPPQKKAHFCVVIQNKRNKREVKKKVLVSTANCWVRKKGRRRMNEKRKINKTLASAYFTFHHYVCMEGTNPLSYKTCLVVYILRTFLSFFYSTYFSCHKSLSFFPSIFIYCIFHFLLFTAIILARKWKYSWN